LKFNKEQTMLFALNCTDKPNSLELRMKLRPDHIVYLNKLGSVAKFAGPFLDEAGNMCGTLAVIEAGDRAEAEKIAAADPYAVGGLFASVEIKAWRWALKNPDAA
jgi:uncharacterized protein